MNLSWLEDFLALAASGNFSRAAEDRHMTQPAFSRRIRALEEWLGAELFDRSSQPARLTAAGDWLQPLAEDLLARVARMPGEARAVAESNAATLQLAATHALSFSFVPGWLQSLQAHTQAGPIRLVSDVLLRCEALLRGAPRAIRDRPCGAAGEAQRAGDCGRTGRSRSAATGCCRCARRRRRTQRCSRSATSRDWAASCGSGWTRSWRAGGLQTVFTAHLASVLKTMALEGRGLAWLPESLVRGALAGSHACRSPGVGAALSPSPWRSGLYRDPAPLGGVCGGVLARGGRACARSCGSPSGSPRLPCLLKNIRPSHALPNCVCRKSMSHPSLACRMCCENIHP